MKLFRNKKRELVEHLQFEIFNEKRNNDILSKQLSEMIDKSKELKTSLKSVLKELTEANAKIDELKTSNILLEKEIFAKEQLIEIKENQRRKSAGKVGDLTKKIKKIQDEKEGQNEIIKSLNRDNANLKGLVKSNKDARTYLRGKAERE